MSRSKHKIRLISGEDAYSPLSEAYRQLRTNIDFSNIDTEMKVIMLTPAGEASSGTSANLAIAYAQAGKKVILLDANLRNPSQHDIFQVSNREGLTTLLSRQTDLHKVIQTADVNNLYLITSGPVPASPAEMLGSKQMGKILEELRQIYDVIIIDTPPVLAASDAQIIGALSDGVLLVIDSGKVKREVVLKAKASLEIVKAQILGAVLNNVEPKHISSYVS